MKKVTLTELKKFMKSEAKRLHSDFEDVPEWVLASAVRFFNEKLPSERDKIISTAEQYLCHDNEVTIEEMIKKIAAHKDETEIIDYIDGVNVWEKVEYSFTVKDFLFTIGYKKEFFK